ncbi:MAG: sulfurtransferase complex subunit TusB [Bermanella sp.]
MVLHLIQRSPFSSTTLSDCLNIIGKEDSLLFMQDGVYIQSHPSLASIKNSVYFLYDDLKARGIEKGSTGKSLNYQEFVQLCTQHDKIISWY